MVSLASRLPANGTAQVHRPAPSVSRHWLRAVAKRDVTEIAKFYVDKAAMVESSGALGGYIVPVDYSASLLSAVAEHSIIRPRAMVVPMKSRETLCPIVNATTVQAAGTSPFFGGIVFNWNGAEGSSLGQSEPTFGQLSLTAWDLIGQLVASNQFVEDLTDEGEVKLIELFGRASAWYEEYAYFRGLGAALSMPLGMINAPGAIAITRNASNRAKIEDVRLMTAKMLPLGWNHAIWVCSPTVVADLTALTGYVPNMDLVSVESGCIGFLAGRPVYVTEKLPPLGTKGDLIFIDPSMYVIGDRQETIVSASPHPLFTTQQTVFRVWRRVDGRPLLGNFVTLADASSTASPFVVLN